jgi:hypothetical protein
VYDKLVDESFAHELLERDAPVLGLSSASELVREGLRLLHRQAREQAMADSYDNRGRDVFGSTG